MKNLFLFTYAKNFSQNYYFEIYYCNRNTEDSFIIIYRVFRLYFRRNENLKDFGMRKIEREEKLNLDASYCTLLGVVK